MNLATHLEVDRYGDFWLTDAIRPARNVPVVPRQGYRIDVYRDAEAGLRVPVLAAAVSRERLFDVFLSLLPPLGATVNVVLETSHFRQEGGHKDLVRTHIDLPVLMSHCCDFEDLLLHDGCTGLAVVSRSEAVEVQFDEHKLLLVYARDLSQFAAILDDCDIPRHDDLQLITEGAHLHSSSPDHFAQFEQLCCRLGIDEPAEYVNG
ncbi:MAG: hypothetical protein ACRELF_18590 [Gemmataceae bacterium]